MLENMTKEELIEEVKKMRTELYHLKMAKEFNISPTVPRPDGYASPATRPVSETPEGSALPNDRSGQIPSVQDKYAPWTDTEITDINIPTLGTPVKERIEAAAEKITAYKKEAEEEDKKEYSGWCLRITDLDGLKFLYLKSPDDRSLSLEVDTSPMVNNIPNRPQVLFQFANTVGARDIPGVWPRWWKLDRSEERFVITCGRLSYTITPKFAREEKLLEDFFNHLQTIRVRSIDEADGVL